MIRRIRSLARKHQQLIRYLVCGLITTVLSLGACYLTLRLGVLIWRGENGEPTAALDVLASTVQWVVGVIVAFLTNKRYVFVDAEKGRGAAFRQFLTFSGSRVATYFLEVVVNLGCIALLETLMDQPWVIFGIPLTARLWAKGVSSVVVVFTNYYISKQLVFRNRKKEKKERETESG